MSDTKYNGWTNYETWRVNLEMVQEEDYHDYLDNVTEDHPLRVGFTRKVGKADREAMAYGLKEEIKERVEEYVESNMVDDTLTGWVNAFMSEVNWYEIAWGIADAYAEYMEEKCAE